MRSTRVERRRVPPLGAAIASLASVAALASAVWGVKVVLPQLDGWRDYYGARDPVAREHEIELSLGFDVDEWERLRSSLGAGDRYVVVADGLNQHEVRNYAAYSLLPAIQVGEIGEANVVVYYATDSATEPSCARIGPNICIARRAAS
jgi:hypothetical protein